MDIVSAGFLVLVVFLGGFIALVADNLGRRLGKKRHTLFGLRPRHTAALITAGAGILIPFITVGVITYASEDIRKWLFEGRQAIREAGELQRQVDDLKTKKSSLDIEVKDKVRQAKALNEKLSKVSAQLQQYKDKASRYLELARTTNLKIQALRSKMADLNLQLTEQRAQVAKTKEEVKSKIAKLNKLKTDIDRALNEVKESYAENQRLGMDNQKLQENIEEIRSQIDNLTAEKKNVENDLAAANQALDEARKTFNDELATINDKLDKARQTLTATQSMLIENIDASRFQPMIFSLQEEVWRTQVPANVSESEATSLLSSMLRSSRILAESRGAKATKDHASADLWQRTTDQGVLSVEDQKLQIIKSIANKSESSVIIAYASFNAFRGEWVRLTVKGYRNPVIYRAGQTIAEGPIDGTKTDEEIVLQISDFIHSKVTPQAEKDKMIPATGRDNAFGTVPTEDLLALVKQIKEANRRIKLRVAAAQDTRAADELKLKFVIR